MTNDTATFDLSRRLPLPPDRLWPILTDPREREHWGAPEPGMVLTVERADLREGGQDRHRCGPADAPDFTVDTRWYRLDPPNRAVFTETVFVGGAALGTSLVTYVLTAAQTGTNLGLTVHVSAFGGPDMLDEFRAGWDAGLATLERHVADRAGMTP